MFSYLSIIALICWGVLLIFLIVYWGNNWFKMVFLLYSVIILLDVSIYIQKSFSLDANISLLVSAIRLCLFVAFGILLIKKTCYPQNKL
jgi:hypothetical protein